MDDAANDKRAKKSAAALLKQLLKQVRTCDKNIGAISNSITATKSDVITCETRLAAAEGQVLSGAEASLRTLLVGTFHQNKQLFELFHSGVPVAPATAAQSATPVSGPGATASKQPVVEVDVHHGVGAAAPAPTCPRLL